MSGLKCSESDQLINLVWCKYFVLIELIEQTNEWQCIPLSILVKLLLYLGEKQVNIINKRWFRFWTHKFFKFYSEKSTFSTHFPKKRQTVITQYFKYRLDSFTFTLLVKKCFSLKHLFVSCSAHFWLHFTFYSKTFYTLALQNLRSLIKNTLQQFKNYKHFQFRKKYVYMSKKFTWVS